MISPFPQCIVKGLGIDRASLFILILLIKLCELRQDFGQLDADIPHNGILFRIL